MKKEVIYGEKPVNPNPEYVELTLKDDGKLDINLCGEVWHLIMKDINRYEEFKAEVLKAIKEIKGGGDDIGYLTDFIQSQDWHDEYVDFDCPACDTEVLVTIDEIDDYVKEVSARLICAIEGECDAKDMFKYKIKPDNPFDGFSPEYWTGVMATLNWITMGSEKHDPEPQ